MKYLEKIIGVILSLVVIIGATAVAIKVYQAAWTLIKMNVGNL